MDDFDRLPRVLRNILNDINECLDPRYILGLYKTRGLVDTVQYLEDIGVYDRKRL
jgi:hypothetical protein